MKLELPDIKAMIEKQQGIKIIGSPVLVALNGDEIQGLATPPYPYAYFGDFIVDDAAAGTQLAFRKSDDFSEEVTFDNTTAAGVGLACNGTYSEILFNKYNGGGFSLGKFHAVVWKFQYTVNS